MISPTGQGVRSDSMGDGHFGASRDGGTRLHNGTDFICNPGQEVASPIDGKIVRVAKPYANDSNYSGVAIENGQMSIQMFYLEPYSDLIGKLVRQGDPIGTAQDIAAKYGGVMVPHIHLQVDRVDPELLMEE